MVFFTIPELGPPKKIQIEPLLGCPGTGSGWIQGARISGLYNPPIYPMYK